MPSTATTATAATTRTSTSAPSTPTAPVSTLVDNYEPLSPSQINTTSYNCAQGENIRIGNQTWEYFCGYNYPFNDIVCILAYTVYDCVTACYTMNTVGSSVPTTKCAGIVYNPYIAMEYSSTYGNCWLKSTMVNPAYTAGFLQVSAVLKTDGS
jgi:hypothetical protein